MKYKFQFKALLNLRQHQEKKAQQILSRLLQQRAQFNQQIDSLNDELEEYGAGFSQKKTHKALAVRHQYEARQDLQKKIWSLCQNRTNLEQKIEAQRLQLRKANQQTQMLQKLKDRNRAKFIKQQQHLEQLQQNEIATQMYNRLN